MITAIDTATTVIPAPNPGRATRAALDFEALFYQSMLQGTHLFQSMTGGSGIGMWETFFIPKLAEQLAQQHALGFGNLLLTQNQTEGRV